jgi:aryl-alcohol dehydrogenase-like predicted oxidoreductase
MVDNKRILGSTGLEVSSVAFGGNVFGWTVDEATSFSLLDGFAGAGLNFIDTADSYSRWAPGNKGGESETIIGNWMKSRNNRDKIILATKVGSAMAGGTRDVSKAYILKAVDDSLRRLQTDYIDLYQTHWDVETTPVEETLEAHSLLLKAGKVRHIGASNLSPERLKASFAASERLGYARYETLQPLYNLYERELFETQYAPICKEQALAVISYYSLASGFLTGKYRSEADLSKSARGEGIKKYFTDRGHRILHALDTVASETKSSAASVALAWLIARPITVIPIASATSLSQLDALVQATALRLNSEAIALLDNASAY